MKKLATVLAIIGVVAMSLGLASCGDSSSDGKEGGTLRGAYASFPDYLDPALSYTLEGWTAMYNTYLPLLTYAHENGEAGSRVVPGLAESLPQISEDEKTYTLTLREGLKYSDGTPVKASDFKSTVERLFELDSPGTPFYTGIVGAEEFQETKKGGISGIETDDASRKITIRLTAPRGTFTNELALLFVALVPADTPAKNLSADPPPATGPYEIVSSEPGRGWSYERNPQWQKANGEAMPDLPDGHLDAIDIDVVRNASTQVNEVERGSLQWMQAIPPADRYAEVKREFEGTQFRVEPTISVYYFWMNTSEPPFDDLALRKAVNYAVDPAALERIYTGTLKASQQILPPGIPGYEKFELYPHNEAKAKQLVQEADPSDREVTIWTNTESPNDEAGAYFDDVLTKLGFETTLKTLNADDYFAVIGNENTPDLNIGYTSWFQDYPHPNDFFQPMLAGESIAPTFNTNLARIDVPKLNEKIAKLSEEQLGTEQEAEYAELDREYMELAPWAPYGNRTVSTFVSSDVVFDEIVFNPTFGQDLTSFQLK